MFDFRSQSSLFVQFLYDTPNQLNPRINKFRILKMSLNSRMYAWDTHWIWNQHISWGPPSSIWGISEIISDTPDQFQESAKTIRTPSINVFKRRVSFGRPKSMLRISAWFSGTPYQFEKSAKECRMPLTNSSNQRRKSGHPRQILGISKCISDTPDWFQKSGNVFRIPPPLVSGISEGLL